MKRACNVAVTPVDSDSSHLRDGFDTLTLVERSLFARMLFFHCERREHPERPLFFARVRQHATAAAPSATQEASAA